MFLRQICQSILVKHIFASTFSLSRKQLVFVIMLSFKQFSRHWTRLLIHNLKIIVNLLSTEKFLEDYVEYS